jgi:hypothetical protein
LGAAFLSGCHPRESGTAQNGIAMGVDERGKASLDSVNMIQPPDVLERLKERALAGDNRAARDVANHYAQAGPMEEELRWLTLGANRGDCAAMADLKDHATRAGDRPRAARWNDQLRRHVCTWDKAYQDGRGPGTDTLPLWDED